MSALTANDKAGNGNVLPVTRTGEPNRRPVKRTALVVLIRTDAKTYGVAVLLRFPVPSVAVTVVAAPGADLASGRRI